MTTDPKLRLLSLGAGVQSTALTIMSAVGDLPKLDGAIFSDTGWEPRAVYDHLNRLEREVLKPAGIPLYRVSAGNIRNDALDPDHRFASMPLFIEGPPRQEPIFDGVEPCPAACRWAEWLAAWNVDDPADAPLEPGTELELLDGTKLVAPDGDCDTCGSEGSVPRKVGEKTVRDQGMTRRQCTSEYKIKPIKQKTRELLGYPHPTPVPKGVYVEQWVGISRDEWHRAKTSDVKYARNVFPLLDLDMTRDDCTALLEAHGFGTTPKSACIGCPFHGNRAWRELRDTAPDEWADAVAFDHAIRGGSARANALGSRLRGTAYLHSSRTPLDEAPIDHVTRKERLELEGDGLLDLIPGDGDEEIAGCSPFGCRADETELPFIDLDEIGAPA